MSKGSTIKQSKLDELERELRARLRVDLAAVASGRDSLYFYNADHNPFELPTWRLSKHGAETYRLACQVRDLRAELGEPAECEASLLLAAILRHADRDDHHRPSPKRLAAELAADLEKLIPEDARGKEWFGARTVFRHPQLERERGRKVYEERVVLILATDLDDATRRAEEEAQAYAGQAGKYLGYVNVFRIGGPINAGTEVFSVTHSTDLDEDELVARFHDDGTARE